MLKNLKIQLSLYLVYKFLSSKFFMFLPDIAIANAQYLLMFGRFPNLINPRLFSEKIQWMKLNVNLTKYGKYVDKYEVRKYVKKSIGDKYLIPILGVWDNFDDIEFDKLPDKFVLKATHGANFNYICKDKSQIDKKAIKETIVNWQKENFYIKTREKQYKDLKPRIICEKYMENYDSVLIDYKFLCYQGKPKFVDVHIDRFIKHRSFYMNMKWKLQPFHVAFEPDNVSVIPDKPANFKEMILIAGKLAKQFPFVRIDLYSINKRTYFGEMTFTPANGLLKFKEHDADYLLGKELNLQNYR